ncbi:MAG: hypothetical protein PUB86_07555 [Elusimicrobia bacterium]|nr:hypothetical protein [Elusimicrobiota bacterium]
MKAIFNFFKNQWEQSSLFGKAAMLMLFAILIGPLLSNSHTFCPFCDPFFDE